MKVPTTQPGSTMLLVVMLMSILLVLCTRMWRSTAYVVDIALQKQQYTQKKWAVRGVLKCGVAACKTDFGAVHAHVAQQGGSLTVPLSSYRTDIAQIQKLKPSLMFKVINDTTLHVTGELADGKKTVLATSCIVHGPMLSDNAPL